MKKEKNKHGIKKIAVKLGPAEKGKGTIECLTVSSLFQALR